MDGQRERLDGLRGKEKESDGQRERERSTEEGEVGRTGRKQGDGNERIRTLTARILKARVAGFMILGSHFSSTCRAPPHSDGVRRQLHHQDVPLPVCQLLLLHLLHRLLQGQVSTQEYNYCSGRPRTCVFNTSETYI